ncbi:unnamed protein product, partial [Didymodactylos carnosus]
YQTIIHGRSYGGLGGDIVKESLSQSISSRLVAVQIYSCNWIQALKLTYSTENTIFHYNNKTRLESNEIYGDYEKCQCEHNLTTKCKTDIFKLSADENIIKVTVVFGERTPSWLMHQSIYVILGIQFETNKNHLSSFYGDRRGIRVDEQFNGYKLKYITARVSNFIHRIQFHWDRDDDSKEKQLCMKMNLSTINIEKDDSLSDDCYKLPYGLDYKRKRNYTISNRACQTWKSIRYTNSLSFSNNEIDDEEHNYCRNPTNKAHGPWCYVNDLGHWEYCGIPLCGK